MSSKNSRINIIVVEQDTVALLPSIAEQEQKEKLERCEEVALSAIAQARDIQDAETVSHADAWK